MASTTQSQATKKRWFGSGYDAFDQENESRNRNYGPPRHWLKMGETKELLFVTDEPFVLKEHEYELRGRFGLRMTCLQGHSDATPCCDLIGFNSLIGLYTVVNCSKYTDKKGVAHQYELQAVAAKKGTVAVLRKKKNDRTSLVGCLYKVTRYNEKEPRCGGEFEFNKELDEKAIDKLFKVTKYKGKLLSEMYAKADEDPKAMQELMDLFLCFEEVDGGRKPLVDDKGKLLRKIFPFNFEKQYEPLDAQTVRSMLAGYQPTDGRKGAAEGGTETPQDDDIPF